MNYRAIAGWKAPKRYRRALGAMASLAALACSADLGDKDDRVRDRHGNVLCDPKQQDCSAFTEGYDVGTGSFGRLNRSQYARTMRDLLGTELNPAQSFPSDDLVLGFDTVGATLRVQPEHAELYLAATEVLIDELFAHPADDPRRARHLDCDFTTGAECQRQILVTFASLAWRRPVDPAELDPFLSFIARESQDLSVEQALKGAMRAVLLSPHFMYRIEVDPNPDDPTPHPLLPHELANRLSYFVWGTMPDDELLSAAESGAISQTDGLAEQLERLLADDRARVLVTEFASQWLNVYGVRGVNPDAEVFPAFSAPLQEAMVNETQLLLAEFMHSAEPLSGLLTAEHTYVNEALAQHYGFAGVVGDEFQRVSTEGTTRYGILTHGSFLTGTSNPTRTSPVKRGLHVLERILCSAPPAPPGDVSLNIDEGEQFEDLSVRERLELHVRVGGACASCHVVMDAIGLGLENYDGIGSYRDHDEYGPIDATGDLLTVDGSSVSFDGARQLADILSTDERINWCAVEKMLIFGLGREFRATRDRDLLEVVSTTARAGGGSFRSAVEAVVLSNAFRQRRAEVPTER